MNLNTIYFGGHNFCLQSENFVKSVLNINMREKYRKNLDFVRLPEEKDLSARCNYYVDISCMLLCYHFRFVSVPLLTMYIVLVTSLGFISGDQKAH